MLRWLNDRPRSGSPKVGYTLLAVLVLIFVIPLYTCSCEGRLKTVPRSEPTEDHFEFKRVGCRWCEGDGRITLYNHWRAELKK